MNMIDKIQEKFRSKIIKLNKKSERRIYIDINPSDILIFSRYLFSELNGRFVIASSVDTPGGIEIIYHFSFDSQGIVLSLRILLDKVSSEVESLCSVFKAAE